jgi:hypothetical protein
MFDKLDRIIEYRTLKAQLERPERTMTGTERARYMRLRDQLSGQVPALDERDSFTLLAEPLPARVVAAGTQLEGSLCNASAVGIALGTDGPPPALGERVTVTARDLHHGTEYSFAGSVISRVVKGTFGMAIALETVGSKTRIGGQSGVYPTRTSTLAPEPVGRSSRPSAPTTTMIGNPHGSERTGRARKV